jgi:citrate synthase
VRGRSLTEELMGKVSFTELIWLLVTGSMPSAAQRAVLDSTLVAIAEHGLVPSAQVARMTLAAAPEALQGAVAAGLLGCGSVVLGASEAAGRFYADIAARAAAPAGLDAAIGQVVGEYRSGRRSIPGYGHPLHKGHDPRAQRLLAICRQAGLGGRHIEIAERVEQLLPQLAGRIPSVLLDAGYPLLALKGVPLLARTAGLIGHLLEEQQRAIGFVMSHAAAQAIDYDGEVPPGFVPSANA